MRALLSFHPFFTRRFRLFFAALTLSLVTLAAGTALLGVSGWFLTAAALTSLGAAFNLFGPSALVRGFSLLRIVARYGEKLVGHDATLKLLTDLRSWQFRRLIPLVPLQKKEWRRGDLVSRLTADIDALDTVFLTVFGPVLTAVATGLIMSLVIAFTLPEAWMVYAWGFFTAALIVPTTMILLARRPGRESLQAAAQMRVMALDGVEGHADLRGLGAAQWAQDGFRATASTLFRTKMRQSSINAMGVAAVQAVGGLTVVGLLWLALAEHESGTLSGPLLVGLLLAALASFEAAAGVARNASKLGAAQAAAVRVRALSQIEPAIADVPRPNTLAQGGGISFEGVYFGYDSARSILKRFDLSVSDGDRIAIVGSSGSGKSTILHLLLRLADPDRGLVRVAGCDVSKVSRTELHRRVALLTQDTPVFLGTIRDNLLIGKPDATDEECWHALKSARLGEFVRDLPEELETWLGEAGRTLSAGQARRLCLARVLLAPAAVIALDEPTSGLDRETEEAFLFDLAAATEGRTVILVTHARLAPGMVDRIYRLEDGRLNEW